ncbi:MAG: glycine cleavage system protein GcvH [Gammaproteobacteria bacterium]|nr:glycine cleavage system protein GcvH [Gammaproteobacteria bacterium]
MNIDPSNLKYANSHEWARDKGDGTVIVGISDHAQESLGDVVYVELPQLGTLISAGDEAGVVESVKAASDIYTPVSGEIVGTNEQLEEEPEIINGSPYEDGWLFIVKMSNPEELDSLMSADEYTISSEEN